ncbi:phage portal protein [Candidatus Parcubacteria bacterium]|nr:MAG: phage portal protein [Candidatus Parcubacteria bacterium]
MKSGITTQRYLGVGQNPRTLRSEVELGRSRWREAFHNKEEPNRETPKVIPGGSWGRSSLSTDASVRRLVEAMRSQAPGGWSDNRWEQSQHFVGITYAAIHRIGEQMAQSEFQVYVKDDNHQDGKRPVKRGEPGWDLIKLLEKPNHDDTFGEMLYKINLQMDLTGMSLTWMVPNVMGMPMELYSIPTSIAIPQPAINPDYPDGYYRIQPVYPYGPFSSYPTPASAVGAPIPAQWMLRIKYPHPILPYDGYSPQTAMRLHLDEIEQMDRSRWYNMKRGISPSAVLQFSKDNAQPLPEEEIARIRAEMENTFQGPENAGQFYVATPGAELQPWGNKPIDMDYQSGWDQLVSFVLGAGFGITKPAAGMIEDSSYSTLFATLKQLHLITIGPKCNRIASKFTRHLAPFYGDDLIVEIKAQRIDDHEVLSGKLSQLAGNRAMTINELRKALDWPMTDEEWGKERVGEPPAPPGMEGMPPGGGGMGGLEAMMGGGMPGMEGGNPEEMAAQGGEVDALGGMPLPPDLDEEPTEVTESRPLAGKLGLGALGPRKRFDTEVVDIKKKLRARYKKLAKISSNGVH